MPVATLTVYSTQNKFLGEMPDDQGAALIAAGLAKLIRSRDGKVRELHMLDNIQDTGLEKVRDSYLEKLVNSRKTCFREKLYCGADFTGLWRYRLKGCAY